MCKSVSGSSRRAAVRTAAQRFSWSGSWQLAVSVWRLGWGNRSLQWRAHHTAWWPLPSVCVCVCVCVCVWMCLWMCMHEGGMCMYACVWGGGGYVCESSTLGDCYMKWWFTMHKVNTNKSTNYLTISYHYNVRLVLSPDKIQYTELTMDTSSREITVNVYRSHAQVVSASHVRLTATLVIHVPPPFLHLALFKHHICQL